MNFLDMFIMLYSKLYCANEFGNKILSFVRFFLRVFVNANAFVLLKYKKKNRGGLYKKDVIISLTTFPERINRIWIVIECMRKQTLPPKKIILWLSKEQFPSVEFLPNKLIKLQNEVFEIRFVEGDLKSYKKFYYAFREFPNDYVVTIDDDIFYPSTMLMDLVKGIEDENTIVCRYGNNICYDESILPYTMWSKKNNGRKGSFFFGSGGGTVFLPSKLYKDVLDENLFLSLAPKADDVWLNAMARLSGLKIICHPCGVLLPIINKKNKTLCSENIGESLNDVQIKNVSDYYKQKINIDPFMR